MAQALPPDALADCATVSILLTDDAGITGVNARFLDRAEPTDVISFRCPVGPGSGRRWRGEIALNVERAITEGRRRGAAAELALYLAHGCDHLAGSDDSNPVRRRRMLRREQAWLRRAHKLDMVDRLL
jgi:rRNA maturation RNase YbeY